MNVQVVTERDVTPAHGMTSHRWLSRDADVITALMVIGRVTSAFSHRPSWWWCSWFL